MSLRFERVFDQWGSNFRVRNQESTALTDDQQEGSTEKKKCPKVFDRSGNTLFRHRRTLLYSCSLSDLLDKTFQNIGTIFTETLHYTRKKCLSPFTDKKVFDSSVHPRNQIRVISVYKHTLISTRNLRIVAQADLDLHCSHMFQVRVLLTMAVFKQTNK